MSEYTVRLRSPHPKQRAFIESPAKRKIVRAGRRSGKTTGVALLAVDNFLDGHRILYAAPTAEQVDCFWFEVKRALEEPIDAGVFYKNESRHIIELPGTEQRIRAKTAWDADTLRGDWASLLILDEWQLMNEETWDRVGAPMLLDRENSIAVFIYTPPSLHSRSRTKARDPRHAAKMFKEAAADTSGRWEAFHFTSHDNPHISKAALDDITQDMTRLAYEQEILAEDKEDDPRALWRREEMIDAFRVTKHPLLTRVVVGIDPPGGVTECGIVVAGLGDDGDGYILDDRSLAGSPRMWSTAAVAAYNAHDADRMVAEINFGGDMVASTIRTIDPTISYRDVRASRGKAIRAEPVAALYEQGRVHHVGFMTALEDELCFWVPGMGMASPNRMDALVWALTELMLGRLAGFEDIPQAETRKSKWRL